jgi:rhamnulokinase
MPKTTVAAIDLGATSGRAIVGQLSSTGLELTETYRFQNSFHAVGSHAYWDVGRLFEEIVAGLRESRRLFPELVSCGIDTWGVDYVMTTNSGRLAFPVHAYRDERTNPVMQAIIDQGDARRLFDLTGLPMVNYNTGIQLRETLQSVRGISGVVDRVMLLPEYFNFLLTGKTGCDYSHASTTQLLEANGLQWSSAALDYFGIPQDWLAQPQSAGTRLGKVSSHADLGEIDVILVPGHDTSCAFEAIPRQGNSLIISTGTWLLAGAITERPCMGDEAFSLGISNERTGSGGYRPCKILLGLWLLEQIIPSFDKRPQNDAEWKALISAAAERPIADILIDTTDRALFNPSDMRVAVDAQLRAAGAEPPTDLPGYVALICASLGASIHNTANRFESILGKEFENLVIVGGGAKNSLFCQLVANACGKPVTSYDLEATSIGNMAYQLLATGAIASLESFHDLLRPSLSPKVYKPA